MAYSNNDMTNFRRRVHGEIKKNPLWTVLANDSKWYCPYCGEEAIRSWPEGMGMQVEAVLQHLTSHCTDWNEFKGKLRSAKDLGRKRKIRELRTQVKKNVVGKQEWQFTDLSQHWYCPYCAKETKVEVPKNRTMTEEVLQGIVDHIDNCFDFKKKKGQEHPIEFLKKVVTRGNLKKTVMVDIKGYLEKETDVWMQRNGEGAWICPFCFDALLRCDVTSPLFRRENAPRMIAEHLVELCPKYGPGVSPRMQKQKAAAPKTAMASVDDDDDLPVMTAAGVKAPKPEAEAKKPEAEAKKPAAKKPAAKPVADDSDDEPLRSEGPQKAARTWGRDGELAALEAGVTLEAFEKSGEVEMISDADLPATLRTGSGSPKRSGTLDDWRKDIDKDMARLQQRQQRNKKPTAVRPGRAAPEAKVEPGFSFSWEPEAINVPGFELSMLLTAGQQGVHEFIDTLKVGPLYVFAMGSVTQRSEDPKPVAMMARQLLRLHLGETSDPAELLKLINADLFPKLGSKTFVSLLIVLLDARAGRLSYSRAGLIAPMLLRPATRQKTRLQDFEGMVLGADSGPMFDPTVATSRLQLEPGDLFLIHTGGIIDVRNRRREPLGMSRFEHFVSSYGRFEAEYFTDKLREKVDLFTRSDVPSADLVVLALKRMQREAAELSWSR